MLDGLKHALRVRPFLIMLGAAFIVMSAFNGVTTWVEEIIHPRGFTPTEAGIMGALMLLAGIAGAVVLPAVSDRQGKRVRFMVVALLASVPGVLGVAFVSSIVLLYAFAALLGFFLVAFMPLGMQYAAEVANPTPEGTSNGLIQLCGQVSVVYVFVMAALRTSNGSFTVSLVLSAGLLALWALVVSRLGDVGPLQAGEMPTTRAAGALETPSGALPTSPGD
jgi:cyanate permease